MKSLIAISIVTALFAGSAFANESVNESSTNVDVYNTHDFFLEKGNRVKLQFPIEQSKFAWQNLSRFYPTAQIERDGPVYQFPYQIDKKIGEISATVHGESKILNEHLDSYPVDAFLRVERLSLNVTTRCEKQTSIIGFQTRKLQQV